MESRIGFNGKFSDEGDIEVKAARSPLTDLSIHFILEGIIFIYTN